MTMMIADLDAPAVAGGRPCKTTPFTIEKRYGEDDLRELREALDQGSLFYTQGKKVKQFEQEYAEMLGFKYAVASSSGTATIHSALIALGISPGDEVIVPPITDMGTIVPILYQGAIPVFADVDPHTYNLTPASVAEKLTSKTKAVVAVHIGGNACDMDGLMKVADAHSVDVVEDCAQAHGCTYNGKAVGHSSAGGCYSFNEFKHIGFGDGGLFLTNDSELARRARLGTDKCYDREAGIDARNPKFLANNYRMTELQGAVGRSQTRRLPGVIARRRAWVAQLAEGLHGLKGLSLPVTQEGCEHSWWFYMLRVDPAELGANASQFAAAMSAEGIPMGAHYIGTPIYGFPIFADRSAYARGEHPFVAGHYREGLCPNAEAVLDTCVMLKINEGYTQRDLSETVEAFTRVVRWFNANPTAT